jgi:hypothetical protein
VASITTTMLEWKRLWASMNSPIKQPVRFGKGFFQRMLSSDMR